MANDVPTSAGHLLQLFRAGQVSSRRELQRATGLARTTVTSRVDALLDAGYLVEDGPIRETTRGRPAVRLVLDDRSRTLLVGDVGASHGRLAVSTAAGDVLREEVIESTIDRGPARVLDRLAERFSRLLAESGRSPSTLAGVSVGVPGPVLSDGRIARSISMPGWDDYPVGADLQSRFGVPVVIENDANLLGLGEQAVVHPTAHMLVFVKVGTGIGAAIVVDGQVLRGRNAAEGDLGHVKISGHDAVCTCGATGCLAASVSGRALTRTLSREDRPLKRSSDVVALARSGDEEAAQVVTEAGRSLGLVLSTVVGLLNPDVVVVGGDLALAPQLVAGVRQTLFAATEPLSTSSLVVTSSELQDRAGIVGGVLMIQERIFGANAVDAELERRGGVTRSSLQSQVRLASVPGPAPALAKHISRAHPNPDVAAP